VHKVLRYLYFILCGNLENKRCSSGAYQTINHSVFSGTYMYVFNAYDELRLHKRAVSINYLLRVVLDFNSVVFMFYFNWMRVNDCFIL
jgi:hypothetical protein